MKVSIVMTTYNGQKNLIEMLDSIRMQSYTNPIAELLILDDVSTDKTVSVANDYINKFGLRNWRVIKNEKNIGWRCNFKKGITMAEGDIIFLCDQDDIWDKDKIKKMVDFFEKEKKAMLVTSEINIFGNGEGSKLTLENIKRNNNKIVFDETYPFVKRPGCTMAFRKELVKYYNIVWKPEYPHDAVLWILAGLFDGLYIVNEKLTNYRRHEGNVTNGMNHNLKNIISQMERTYAINKWYLEEYKWSNSESSESEKISIVENCEVWCQYRLKLIRDKKLVYFFKLFKYRKYYSTIKRYFGDLYYYTKRNHNA